jgi:hypothetical protein
VKVLGDLHAAQALPDLQRLQQRLRSWLGVPEWARSGADALLAQAALEAVEMALQQLRHSHDLPRPAMGPGVSAAALPIAAASAGTGPHRLPVPADERDGPSPEAPPPAIHPEQVTPLLVTRLELNDSRPPLRFGVVAQVIFGLLFMVFGVTVAPLVLLSLPKTGLVGLLFLLHPLVFGCAGYAMGWDAFLTQSRERVALEGGALVVTRNLFVFGWKRRNTLGPASRARLVSPNSSVVMEEPGLKREILLTDAVGKEIRFGSKLSIYEQQLLVSRLNDALEARQAPPAALASEPDQRPSMS